MAEEIKNLIEKIKSEGIQKGEEQALAIEKAAQAKADKIIAEAKKTADSIVAQAQQTAKQTDRSMRNTLSQAGRDFSLMVKKEVCAMLDALVRQKIKDALTPQELISLIAAAINASGLNQAHVVVSSDDEAKMEKLIFELGEKLKKGITLSGASDIRAGFVISFDQGKSQFDFSEASLAEFISSTLKPKLNTILTRSSDNFESK